MRHSGGVALRLGGLADLDPAAVPLPPGTEVVTRVDRIVDGELRPGGATGRVASPEAVAAIDDWLRDVRKRSW